MDTSAAYSTETERRILQAATDIFLLKGRDGARMQEIADKAGINKAMLHYYFRSKDKLYEQVFIVQLEQFFTGLLDAIPETDDVHAFLEHFIDSYMDSMAANEGLVRFIIWEIQSGAHLMPAFIQTMFSKRGYRKPLFLVKIEQAIDKGQMRNVEPVNFVISLIGLCAYPFIARPVLEKVLGGLSISSTEFLAQRKTEILQLIWNGIRPE